MRQSPLCHFLGKRCFLNTQTVSDARLFIAQHLIVTAPASPRVGLPPPCTPHPPKFQTPAVASSLHELASKNGVPVEILLVTYSIEYFGKNYLLLLFLKSKL